MSRFTINNGDTGANIRAGLNGMTAELYALSQNHAGLRTPILGFAGDSVADFAGGGSSNQASVGFALDSNSPVFWALTKYYPADIIVNCVPYASGGYGFAVGGTTTSDFLNTQVPQIIARPPDILYVSTGQNDNLTSLANANAAANNLISGCNQALAGGVRAIILMGAPPHGSLTGANVPDSIEAYDARQRNYARSTPGIYYVSVLDAIKDLTGSLEDSGSSSTISYRLPIGGKGGTSNDNTHLSMMGGRLMGPRVASALQAIVGRVAVPRDQNIGNFDETLNPYKGYYAYTGLFIGTGGTLNGTSNAGVAVGWALTSGSGVTVTPSKTARADGFIGQRLTFSGTATANVDIVLSRGQYALFTTSRPVTVEGFVDLIGLTGACPPSFSIPNVTSMGGSSGASGILPDNTTETLWYRSRRTVQFLNAGYGTYNMTWIVSIPSGAAVSGAVEFYRSNMFAEG